MAITSDSKLANWAMMVSPSSTFSPAAAQALMQALARRTHRRIQQRLPRLLGAQTINSSESTVPEPATIIIWALAGAALFVTGHRRSRVSDEAAASPLI